ncbi:MAG: response regulator transcription factor [Actinomycetota bacterium]|nr:response regulator transcription factor [Actinomycetota bacterium]
MRILIVEDDATMVVYLKKCLEAEGFSVDTACDGLVGLEKALTQHFDAITLDIMLPGMNGYEVCRELRAAQVDAPILMLTAKDGEYDEADAFDYGADDFLRKPFSLVVLSARLRSLIRRSGVARSSLLAAGDLVLDEAAHRVTRAGMEIELTPREFALLEVLLRNKGQVLDRTQLLEKVWGYDHLGGDNLVEVYIGYLRRKVDDPFPRKLIHTVRGVGYRLEDEDDG